MQICSVFPDCLYTGLIHLSPVLGPIATFIVGCMVYSVARSQARTSANKLAFDLFDRRFALYQKVDCLIDEWISCGNRVVDGETVSRRLLVASRECRFLFGKDLAVSLEAFLSPFGNADMPADPKNQQDVDQKQKDLSSVANKEELIKIFVPYMEMSQKPE